MYAHLKTNKNIFFLFLNLFWKTKLFKFLFFNIYWIKLRMHSFTLHPKTALRFYLKKFFSDVSHLIFSSIELRITTFTWKTYFLGPKKYYHFVFNSFIAFPTKKLSVDCVMGLSTIWFKIFIFYYRSILFLKCFQTIFSLWCYIFHVSKTNIFIKIENKENEHYWVANMKSATTKHSTIN